MPIFTDQPLPVAAYNLTISTHNHKKLPINLTVLAIYLSPTSKMMRFWCITNYEVHSFVRITTHWCTYSATSLKKCTITRLACPNTLHLTANNNLTYANVFQVREYGEITI